MALFFILVFLLSIPFWILDAIVPMELLPGLPLSALAVLVPTLAACIVVHRNEQRAGVIQLLRRAFDFHRGENKNWLLFAILINPVIAVLAFGMIRATGPRVPNPTVLPVTLFILFTVFFVSALAEEIGWTGYATASLMRRWDLITASIILGFVWSVWHFIPLLQAHRSMEWIAWWSLWTVSLRLIMGWLYIQSRGSVFAATLFHAMINLCWQLFPINGSFFDPQVFGLIALGFAIAVFLVERFRTRDNVPAIQS